MPDVLSRASMTYRTLPPAAITARVTYRYTAPGGTEPRATELVHASRTVSGVDDARHHETDPFASGDDTHRQCIFPACKPESVHTWASPQGHSFPTVTWSPSAIPSGRPVLAHAFWRNGGKNSIRISSARNPGRSISCIPDLI